MVGLANLLAGLLGLAVIVLFGWTIVRAVEVVGDQIRMALDSAAVAPASPVPGIRTAYGHR